MPSEFNVANDIAEDVMARTWAAASSASFLVPQAAGEGWGKLSSSLGRFLGVGTMIEMPKDSAGATAVQDVPSRLLEKPLSDTL